MQPQFNRYCFQKYSFLYVPRETYFKVQNQMESASILLVYEKWW